MYMFIFCLLYYFTLLYFRFFIHPLREILFISHSSQYTQNVHHKKNNNVSLAVCKVQSINK